jgi:DHA3 family macrolide efflux protein-like MFS transporter
VLARFVSSSGVEGAFIVGLWGKAAFEFGGTPAELAAMSALVAVAAIVGSTLGGSAVDRWGAKAVVVGAEALFVPATLSLILADDIWTLVLLGTGSWFTGAVLETAITSMPPLLVEDAHLERANARLESANWAALIVGPAVAAPLATLTSVDAVFFLDALSSLVALLLVARAPVARRAPAAEGDPAPGSGWRGTVVGLRYALTEPAIAVPLYLEGLVAVAFGTFIALEPLFFRDVVGVDVATVGYVNAVFGAGLLVGSLALERSADRSPGFRWLVALTIAAGLGGVLYVATASLAVVVVGGVVWAVPLGASLPLSRALAQRHADPAYVGRTMGAFGAVGAGAALLPLAVAPALAAAVGLQAVLVVSAVLAVLGAPLALGRATALDRRAPGPPEPVADALA